MSVGDELNVELGHVRLAHVEHTSAEDGCSRVSWPTCSRQAVPSGSSFAMTRCALEKERSLFPCGSAGYSRAQRPERNTMRARNFSKTALNMSRSPGDLTAASLTILCGARSGAGCTSGSAPSKMHVLNALSTRS